MGLPLASLFSFRFVAFPSDEGIEPIVNLVARLANPKEL